MMRIQLCLQKLNRPRWIAAWLAAWLLSPSLAPAQLADLRLGSLNDVGIEERIGKSLPLDAEFVDASGKRVELSEYFSKERPVLLSLTYTDCPMLCHLQLEGLIRSLSDLEWSPGEQFDVLNISIDPQEAWQQARLTKQKHLLAYGRPETADGWHFLTGDAANIQRVADAVGFSFTFVPKRNEYAHAAAIIVCTPDATVSRYLYGVDYPPRTVRLSLVEAAEGKVGSAIDQVLLFCFHYDATTGQYAPVAFRIMQLGGLLTLGAVLIGVVPFWLRGRRGGQASEAAGAAAVRQEHEARADNAARRVPSHT